MAHRPVLGESALSAAVHAAEGFVGFTRRVGFGPVARMIGKALSHAVDDFSHGSSRPTVLLVQGIACESGGMQELGDVIKNDFNVAYTQDFPGMGFAGIDAAARVVRQRIDELHQRELFVVTHSMGGPATLEALRHRNGVRKLVMLAPPFNTHGVPIAGILSWASGACRQLLPEAKFLNDLSGINLEGHTDVECHVAGNDSIVPVETQLPPSGIRARVVHHNDYAHHDFILGKRARAVADEIVQTLKTHKAQ